MCSSAVLVAVMFMLRRQLAMPHSSCAPSRSTHSDVHVYCAPLFDSMFCAGAHTRRLRRRGVGQKRWGPGCDSQAGGELDLSEDLLQAEQDGSQENAD